MKGALGHIGKLTLDEICFGSLNIVSNESEPGVRVFSVMADNNFCTVGFYQIERNLEFCAAGFRSGLLFLFVLCA